MELLIGTHSLVALGGSETYVLTVAEQLERLGHGVTLSAAQLGEVAEHADRRGLRVAATEDDLPPECDGLITQDAATALALAERYPEAAHLFVAHSATIDLQLPPQLEGLTCAVVVMNDRVERRIRALAIRAEVVRLRQPVDLRRFAPRGDSRELPRKALLLGNYLRGERYELIAAACADAGLSCDRAGRHGATTWGPEAQMADADIVVGHGRSIVEAMACGRAAFVFDQKSSEGWVTPESYLRLEADGFAGRDNPDLLDPESLRRRLSGYTPAMGMANRELVMRHHNAQHHAFELIRVLREAPRPARSANSSLPELARLARVAWRAENRVLEVELETEQLRARLHEAEAEAVRAGRRAEELRSTRRYRLASALARPLDRLRDRLGR